jgi:hypothetical protein
MSAAALACLKHSARKSATDCPCARCADASEIDKANAETSRAPANRVFEFVIIISLLGSRDDAPPECPAISGDHLLEEEESPLSKMEKPRPAFDGVTQAERDEEPVSLFWILSDLASPTQSHARIGELRRGLASGVRETRRFKVKSAPRVDRRSTTLALDASTASSAHGRLTLFSSLVRTIRVSFPSGAPLCALRICRRSEGYHARRHRD